ncbi:MAG: hypothetical protein IPL49_17240 [Saprospirales bacterium]|nr:hypothetical protein [Saprospirales bacterium]
MLSGNVITWSSLTIPASTTQFFTFNAVVDAPTGTPYEYQNVARVLTSDQYDPNSTPGNAADIDGDHLIGSRSGRQPGSGRRK